MRRWWSQSPTLNNTHVIYDYDKPILDIAWYKKPQFPIEDIFLLHPQLQSCPSFRLERLATTMSQKLGLARWEYLHSTAQSRVTRKGSKYVLWVLHYFYMLKLLRSWTPHSKRAVISGILQTYMATAKSWSENGELLKTICRRNCAKFMYFQVKAHWEER